MKKIVEKLKSLFKPSNREAVENYKKIAPSHGEAKADAGATKVCTILNKENPTVQELEEAKKECKTIKDLIKENKKNIVVLGGSSLFSLFRVSEKLTSRLSKLDKELNEYEKKINNDTITDDEKEKLYKKRDQISSFSILIELINNIIFAVCANKIGTSMIKSDNKLHKTMGVNTKISSIMPLVGTGAQAGLKTYLNHYNKNIENTPSLDRKYDIISNEEIEKMKKQYKKEAEKAKSQYKSDIKKSQHKSDIKKSQHKSDIKKNEIKYNGPRPKLIYDDKGHIKLYDFNELIKLSPTREQIKKWAEPKNEAEKKEMSKEYERLVNDIRRQIPGIDNMSHEEFKKSLQERFKKIMEDNEREFKKEFGI